MGAMIWTAVPIWAKRAASYRTCGLIRATLGALGLGQLHQGGLLGNKRAVSSSCSTVKRISAAIPIGFRAASVRAVSLIGATLVALSHPDQLGLFGLNLETTGQCHKGKDHCQNFHV